MADRDRKRVTSVKGYGRTVLQAEEDSDHPSHLLFLRSAVTGHSHLDASGRILVDRDTSPQAGQKNGPTDVPELEGDAGVARQKDVLDRRSVGPQTLQNPLESGHDVRKPVEKVKAAGGNERAVGHGAQLSRMTLDKPEAGRIRPGVYPEDEHPLGRRSLLAYLGIVDVEVRPGILDVVVILQRLHHRQQLLRLLALELDGRLRDH